MSKATSTTHYEVLPGGIAVLTMDSAPVNSLSIGTRTGLVEGIRKAQSDKSVVGIVVRGAGRAFCGGAEISEFAGGGKTQPSVEGLTETLSRLELSPIPTVALIHGFALGGGFEVALSCHYRIASEDTQLGLPEVNLGLLPGAGGTQRLPRVVGAIPATEFIINGTPINAVKGKELGLIDHVVAKKASEKERLDAAVAFLLSKNGATRPISKLPIPDAAAATPAKIAEILKATTAKRRGELAPALIADCIVAAVATAPDFEAGMKVEQRNFGVLLRSAESRALQHQFFAERAAPKLSKELTAPAKNIKSVGIIGAGLMGGGIAMCCADVGIDVVLIDAKQEFLDRGMKVIESNYARSATGKLKLKSSMARIKPSLDYDDLKNVDMIIEAVFEDMKLKKQIFERLDKVCKKGCILGSNTSALDIDEIAAVTTRPEDVIGVHFFSPANVMRLLENVKGKHSSNVTISTAMEFGKRIGKIPVLVGNCPGFVGNRMLGPYTSEAHKMVMEGVPYDRIDRVAKDVIGMNMGPISMNDLVGIDLGARQRVTKGIADPSKNVSDALFAAGRYGQKNGKGYYLYDEKTRAAKYDPSVTELIKTIAKNNGMTQKPADKVTDQEIMERLLFPLINEGFKCLEEQIAQKASDIDVVYCYGYGFPKWRGGPMKFAEEIGLDSLLAGLRKYQRWGHHESYWTPSKMLVQRVTDIAHGKSKL